MDWIEILLWSALALYLVIGLVLTHSLTDGAPGLRLRFRDYVLGAFAMPLLTLALYLFILLQKLWYRLLLALDYEPEDRKPETPRE
jgi:hypothetical protein